MGIQIGGIIGLYGGMICGLLGWYIGRVKAKKQRALDETHHHIWQKARSYSWYVTLVSIYLFFTLHVFGVTLSVAAVLGILLLIHLGSWGIIGMILTGFMYNEKEIKVSDLLIGICIIVISTLVFVCLAIIMDQWMYFIMTLPFSLVGYLFIRKSYSEKES